MSTYPIGLSYGDRAPTPSGTEHGMDVEAPDGSKAHSPVFGDVIYARDNATTGGTVGIYSGGHTYWFGHLKEFGVQEGDTVSVGDFIGLTGGGAHDAMRGDATGPHLWFGVSDGYSKTLSNLINPAPFLDQQTIFQGGATGGAVNASLVAQGGTTPTAAPGKPVSTVLGQPLVSYLKIGAGGFILLVALVIVLAAIGLRSGSAEAAATSVPIVGPQIKRARGAAKRRGKQRTQETAQQRALERRNIRQQASRERQYERGAKSRGKVIDLDAEDKAAKQQRINDWFKRESA